MVVVTLVSGNCFEMRWYLMMRVMVSGRWWMRFLKVLRLECFGLFCLMNCVDFVLILIIVDVCVMIFIVGVEIIFLSILWSMVWRDVFDSGYRYLVGLGDKFDIECFGWIIKLVLGLWDLWWIGMWILGCLMDIFGWIVFIKGFYWSELLRWLMMWLYWNECFIGF